MLLKKNIFRIVAIIYDIVTLFWCYVLGSNLFYNFINISVNKGSIGIIGGADFPIAVFQFSMILRAILPILFIILSLSSVILLTISAFKTSVSKKANIWFICLLGTAITLFWLLPVMTYIVALYATVFGIGVLVYVAKILYYVASFGAIGFTVFSLIKGKEEIK